MRTRMIELSLCGTIALLLRIVSAAPVVQLPTQRIRSVWHSHPVALHVHDLLHLHK